MLLLDFYGQRIVGEVFTRLVAAVRVFLPGSVKQLPLFDSLRYLVNTVPDKQELSKLAHRLAANRHALAAGFTVTPWTAQLRREWVPVQVIATDRALNAKGNLAGVTLSLRILAGSPAPMTITKWWSLKRCAFIGRQIGFSRTPAPGSMRPLTYAYQDPSLLFGMRFYVLLEPTTKSGDPTFEFVSPTGDLITWNRKLLKRRARDTPQTLCPHDQPDSVRCHMCPFGLDKCANATHMRTFVEGPCPVCKDKEAVFDPQEMTRCVNCVRSSVYRRA